MFDEIKRQIELGDLVIIAGQPFSGRTTFAMQLASSLWFYREDACSEYPFVTFYSPIINEKEFEYLSLKHGVSIPLNSCFIENNTLNLKQLEKEMSDIKQIMNSNKTIPQVLFPIYLIDMFHFIDEPLKVNENETVRISKIITSLKQTAFKLNAIVILTSEVNMDSVRKKRDDLLCLRDSIKIGSVADFVFLLKPETNIVKVLKNKRGLRTEFENPVFNLSLSLAS